MLHDLAVEMNANPNLTICFFSINQNGNDIFDKTLSSDGGQRFKHMLNDRAAQGAKVFRTMTVKIMEMSMTYVGHYKDMHL